MAPLSERIIDVLATASANVVLLGVVLGGVEIFSKSTGIPFWQSCVVMLLVQNTAAVSIDRKLWK